MSEYESLLKELERLQAHKAGQVRPLRKSRRQRTRTLITAKRRPDFGQRPAAPDRAPAAANIDLCKAESQLRALDRTGLLTAAQSSEAWRRLMNLRPVQVVPIK